MYVKKKGQPYYTNRHSCFMLQYHMVLVTKYRKPILTGEVKDLVYRIIREIFDEKKLVILELNGEPDHIHLLVDCRPQFYISDMIKIMKGNLARWMFLAHPELKKELWGGHLWNPSYCAVTVSDRSRERILTYIEGQKEKEKTKSS